MAKTDLVCCLIGQHNFKLLPKEKLMLEIKLFASICQELTEIFETKYKEYKSLIKSGLTQEESMPSIKIMQEVVADILATNEYSIAGIAMHTQIPEEVLTDVVSGINTDTTFEASKKIFEVHISVRRNLYKDIMHKIASEYLV